MNMLWLLTLLFLPMLGLLYVAWHVWVLLPLATCWRATIVVVGILCFLTLFLDFSGQLDRFPMPLARITYNVGTSSLIVVLYLVMLFAVLGLGRLFDLVSRNVFYNNWTTAAVIFAVLFVVFLYGRIHYNHKVRVPLEVHTEKALPKDYKVVMASDLHLGYHNRRTELARWVDLINEEKPDLILLAGDLIDISVRPLFEENMAEELRRLEAPVYACLGNHEYYSGNPNAQRFYHDANIHLLIDEAVTIDSALTIIGRDDKTNRQRKSLAELVKVAEGTTSPLSHFVILLDHQPRNLDEANRLDIDFQLSGHTHRGQVWPISWITDRMYECSWGSHKRGKTRYYVSSGLGIWGGRFRIGTQSEYIVATISSEDVRL